MVGKKQSPFSLCYDFFVVRSAGENTWPCEKNDVSDSEEHGSSHHNHPSSEWLEMGPRNRPNFSREVILARWFIAFFLLCFLKILSNHSLNDLVHFLYQIIVEITPVSSIFMGEIRSVVTFPGGKMSTTSQPFMTFPLDIHVRNFG